MESGFICVLCVLDAVCVVRAVCAACAVLFCVLCVPVILVLGRWRQEDQVQGQLQLLILGYVGACPKKTKPNK